MDATGRVTMNTQLFVFYLKAAPFLLNSTRNPSGTERQMLLSHGGLLKEAEHRGQWRGKESWKICFVQRARTHTHTPSNKDRFAFQGQVSEQKGSGAGGAEKCQLPPCQLALPTSSPLLLLPPRPRILGYTVHPVPIEGEEGRRNRREPVQHNKLFKRTSLLRHGS